MYNYIFLLAPIHRDLVCADADEETRACADVVYDSRHDDAVYRLLYGATGYIWAADALLADLHQLRKAAGARKRDAAHDAQMHGDLVCIVFCDVDCKAAAQQRVYQSGRVWHGLERARDAHRRDEAGRHGDPL